MCARPRCRDYSLVVEVEGGAEMRAHVGVVRDFHANADMLLRVSGAITVESARAMVDG